MKAMMLLNPKRRRRRSRRRSSSKRRMRANPISRRRRTRRRSRRNPIAALTNPHRRRRGRRRFRRNPFGGGKIGSTLRNVFGKENLVIAGGAVLGTVATGWILRQPFSANLPGRNTPMGAIAYAVGIPAVLAAVAATASPKLRGLAQGMGIIAAVNLVSTVVAYAQGAIGGATAGTAAYLDAGNGVRALPNRPPGYDGVNAFGQSIYGNESAFRGNTWALNE